MTWAAFVARVEAIFAEFQVAWSTQDLLKARPYMSDNLFQRQVYWVEMYQRAKLKNITEGASVATVQLAKVVSDRYFDAITVRVFAEGLDFTVDEAGVVVGGNRSTPRAYSEYWTLIRGSDRTGAPRSEPVCPNCGAGLDINMAGQCKYCNAAVTTGQFDWVLSRIEQDEAYG
jgi:predicted lipid-binding transport protein (Tim44 family)